MSESTESWYDANMVREFDQWLDDNVGQLYKPKDEDSSSLAQHWARIVKVSEELGEAVQIYIGLTGQNPRKGMYGKWDDLYDELADVALTAIYAIQHFLKDSDATATILRDRLHEHYNRVFNPGQLTIHG